MIFVTHKIEKLEYLEDIDCAACFAHQNNLYISCSQPVLWQYNLITLSPPCNEIPISYDRHSVSVVAMNHLVYILVVEWKQVVTWQAQT